MSITDSINKIEKSRTTYGIFGKMDKVLKLSPLLYTRAERQGALAYFAQKIRDDATRDLVLDVYCRRLR